MGCDADEAGMLALSVQSAYGRDGNDLLFVTVGSDTAIRCERERRQGGHIDGSSKHLEHCLEMAKVTVMREITKSYLLIRVSGIDSKGSKAKLSERRRVPIVYPGKVC